MAVPGWVRHPLVFWLVWHALALITFFALAGLRLGQLPWRISSAELTRAATFAAGYVLGAAALHLLAFRGRRPRLVEVLLAGFAGFGLVFYWFLAADLQVSRMAMTLAFAGGVVLLLLGFLITRYRLVLVGLLAIGIIAMMGWTAESGAALTQLPRTRAGSTLATSLTSVQATIYRNYIPRSASHFTGGGIAPFGQGHLVVTSDGELLMIEWDEDGSPQVEPLPARVPLNREEFAADAGNGSYVAWFRAFDVLVREHDGSRQVYVSHHRWSREGRCFVVRVSRLEFGAGSAPGSGGEWRTVHETEPCLSLVSSRPAWPFRGMEGGGRMLLLDPDHLLLSVGDQGYNGVDFPDQPDWVQNPSASYGKTVRISLADGSWQPYTIGHRNPQGLLSDGQGRIWLTEHGPQGGDELNLLTAGSNYGWPKVTYGTDYGKQAWPLNPRQGRHEGFVEPVYSWAKSIGPSNLIEIRGNLFTSWAGDLLIGTLVGESLMRIRLDQGLVRLIEPIPVGERVRDLIEDSSGRIVLLTDSYSLVVLEPAQSSFAMCAGCHALTGEPGSGLGPDLGGVLGSAIAGRPGFAYSEALKKVGGVWTEAELDRFLTDPQAFAPGSSMTMAGIPDADIRRRVIEFLKTP